MTVALTSASFLVAALCAALMGFAIQRGATCMVAAVGELVDKGSANRLIALAETSLWVAGGLIIARAAGALPALPSGFAITPATFFGAILLGLGAFANRACVFGSIAKLGSGEWAYLLTPFGFFTGVAVIAPVFGKSVPMLPLIPYAGPAHPAWLALAFATFALWRLYGIARRLRSETDWRMMAKRALAPHEATLLIGITFVIMLVCVGAWSYPDMLIRLAHGMTQGLVWRTLLFLALLIGAGIGGMVGGKIGLGRFDMVTLIRCLVGGVLMGWGSVMIPGSNDGLILTGMPLLWPYAWVAILTMSATLWVVIRIEQALANG
ncbi:MAG: hypothetical protein RL367_2538 [Pseudomonadota bacterium]